MAFPSFVFYVIVYSHSDTTQHKSKSSILDYFSLYFTSPLDKGDIIHISRSQNRFKVYIFISFLEELCFVFFYGVFQTQRDLLSGLSGPIVSFLKWQLEMSVSLESSTVIDSGMLEDPCLFFLFTFGPVEYEYV